MALYAASTGPVPRPVATCVMPSGPSICTVAVGRPLVPQTTCVPPPALRPHAEDS